MKTRQMFIWMLTEMLTYDHNKEIKFVLLIIYEDILPKNSKNIYIYNLSFKTEKSQIRSYKNGLSKL